MNKYSDYTNSKPFTIGDTFATSLFKNNSGGVSKETSCVLDSDGFIKPSPSLFQTL